MQVVQQQVISRVKVGEVEYLGVATNAAVKKLIYKLSLCMTYRQVLKDILRAEVAKPRDSEDKEQYKKMMDLSPSSARCSAPLEETRGCSAQYVLLDMLEVVGLDMATHLFLQQLARGTTSKPASRSQNFSNN